MAVRFDRSDRSIVVYCTDCPNWAQLVTRDERAHDVAAEHERMLHPQSDQARGARDVWRARHAAV